MRRALILSFPFSPHHPPSPPSPPSPFTPHTTQPHTHTPSPQPHNYARLLGGIPAARSRRLTLRCRQPTRRKYAFFAPCFWYYSFGLVWGRVSSSPVVGVATRPFSPLVHQLFLHQLKLRWAAFPPWAPSPENNRNLTLHLFLSFSLFLSLSVGFHFSPFQDVSLLYAVRNVLVLRCLWYPSVGAARAARVRVHRGWWKIKTISW